MFHAKFFQCNLCYGDSSFIRMSVCVERLLVGWRNIERTHKKLEYLRFLKIQTLECAFVYFSTALEFQASSAFAFRYILLLLVMIFLDSFFLIFYGFFSRLLGYTFFILLNTPSRRRNISNLTDKVNQAESLCSTNRKVIRTLDGSTAPLLVLGSIGTHATFNLLKRNSSCMKYTKDTFKSLDFEETEMFQLCECVRCSSPSQQAASSQTDIRIKRRSHRNTNCIEELCMEHCLSI